MSRAALLLALWAAPLAAQAPEPLPGVRPHYLAAVRDEAAIDRGLQAIDALRAAGRIPSGGPAEAVADAYRGALITLRAKHGSWPPARLRHMREGLALLDRAVTARPDHAEIRFLRLMSCFYLPGVLGRGRSVREDFAALARLLPAAREDYPADLYASMVRFVLENGDVSAADRPPLEAALAGRGDG